MSQRLQDAVRFHREGRLSDAENLYREHLKAHPGDVRVLWALAHACYMQKNLLTAIACLEQAVVLDPTNAEFHFTLANLLAERRADPAQTVTRYRVAIALRPDHGPTWLNLGVVHYHAREFQAAIEALSRAIGLDANDAKALHNLGLALMRAGRAVEADEMLRRASELARDIPAIHTCLLFNLHNVPGLSCQSVFDEHLRWAARYGANTTAHSQPPTAARIAPGRPIRVGYLSPDFRRHSVFYFIHPVLKAHDRAVVTSYCYSDVEHPDEVTRQLMGSADHWRDISQMDDEQAFRQIQQDEIDILVDLAGHTYRNRLRMMSHKAAPVQVSWLGYPGTTGLKQMDYRITDSRADPEGESDGLYTEKLVRLEKGFLCYEPPSKLPVRATTPAQQTGYATFGSFNNLAKINDEVIHAWCRILQRVPGSKLVLKAPGLGDSSGRNTVMTGCWRHGIGEDRIECIGHTEGLDSHLSTYHRIDIALDTFPYNGTTTICEALWMGVPVITFAGDRHASRVGASLLTTLDLTELIAQDPAGYVDLAVRFAEDRAALDRVRTGLRERMRRAPLMDASGFCRSLEVQFQRMQGRCL